MGKQDRLRSVGGHETSREAPAGEMVHLTYSTVMPFFDEKLITILKKKNTCFRIQRLKAELLPGALHFHWGPCFTLKRLPFPGEWQASNAIVLSKNSGVTLPFFPSLLLPYPNPNHQQSERLCFQNYPRSGHFPSPQPPLVPAPPSPLAYYNSLLNSLCRLGPAETHLFASPPSPLSVGMTEAHLTQWVVGTGAHSELQDRCGQQQQQQLPGPLQTSNTLAFAGFPNFTLYVSSLISRTFP